MDPRKKTTKFTQKPQTGKYGRPAPQQQRGHYAPTKKKDNTLIIVGCVAAALVIVIVIVIVASKKKSGADNQGRTGGSKQEQPVGAAFRPSEEQNRRYMDALLKLDKGYELYQKVDKKVKANEGSLPNDDETRKQVQDARKFFDEGQEEVNALDKETNSAIIDGRYSDRFQSAGRTVRQWYQTYNK